MFGRLLRKLGLAPAEAAIADKVIETVADRATGGAASKVEDAVGAVGKVVKDRRKRGAQGRRPGRL